MDGVSKEKLKTYYEFALELVMKCGHVFREGYEKINVDNYKVKSDFYDLVTVYDKQIEDLLAEGLREQFPESKIIGEEESALTKRISELTNDPTWIIDPIDGTTNYIHKIPHCCISVGLAINKELVAGIIFNPILNEMYSAWRGHGAYLNGQRIHVSNCTEMNKALISFEISLIHAAKVRDKNVKRAYKLAANAIGSRCLGSAALSLCYVANGSTDGYHVEDLQPWDIAAGAVIIREAGGYVCHTQGGPFNVMKPDVVCAGTKELAERMMQLISEADQITEYTFK